MEYQAENDLSKLGHSITTGRKEANLLDYVLCLVKSDLLSHEGRLVRKNPSGKSLVDRDGRLGGSTGKLLLLKALHKAKQAKGDHTVLRSSRDWWRSIADFH
jgi:hypothetical protein